MSPALLWSVTFIVSMCFEPLHFNPFLWSSEFSYYHHLTYEQVQYPALPTGSALFLVIIRDPPTYWNTPIAGVIFLGYILIIILIFDFIFSMAALHFRIKQNSFTRPMRPCSSLLSFISPAIPFQAHLTLPQQPQWFSFLFHCFTDILSIMFPPRELRVLAPLFEFFLPWWPYSSSFSFLVKFHFLSETFFSHSI